MIEKLIDSTIDTYSDVYLQMKSKLQSGVRLKVKCSKSNIFGLEFSLPTSRKTIKRGFDILSIFSLNVSTNSRHTNLYRSFIFGQNVNFNLYKDDFIEIGFENQTEKSILIRDNVEHIFESDVLLKAIEKMNFSKEDFLILNITLLKESTGRIEHEKIALNSENYYSNLLHLIYVKCMDLSNYWQYNRKLKRRNKKNLLEVFNALGVCKNSGFIKEITKIKSYLEKNEEFKFTGKSIDEIASFSIVLDESPLDYLPHQEVIKKAQEIERLLSLEIIDL